MKPNILLKDRREEERILPNEPDVLTLKEMQKILHIGKNTALKLMHEGIIEGHWVGNKWLIFKEDVIEYILRS